MDDRDAKYIIIACASVSDADKYLKAIRNVVVDETLPAATGDVSSLISVAEDPAGWVL